MSEKPSLSPSLLSEMERLVLEAALAAGLVLHSRQESAWGSIYLSFPPPDGGVGFRASKKQAALFRQRTGFFFPRNYFFNVRIADHPARNNWYQIHAYFGTYIKEPFDLRLERFKEAVKAMMAIHQA